MKIDGKNIVITGASKGLGRELALHLSRKNANVILIARTESLLRKVQTEIETLTAHAPCIIQCDISSEKEVLRMRSIIENNFTCVDVLINNAGFGTYEVSEKLSNQEMRKHFEVNFFGAYYCTKALLPLIKKSDCGYILNVGSLFSKISLAENSVYAATKFALAGFTEGLREELRPCNIKVGLLLPGSMATSFQDNKDNNIRAPAFMTLKPEKVAKASEKMIRKRKKQMIIYRWMMYLIKIRQLFA
ncbi:SDR family NAD(P)-dependent oxidoreductase [Methanosarcina acetivorans]|uniref:Short chain dehydrogenase n=1 Tax=Methanosarcina acetivorans (strain ATCC 35395 / DSM 2834 / JCM 12185 / C2A) TaxID=188937 RepID=Q8TP33_METAC|nr:SDR family oxidoreductase [Methanosarcina acetivorans]AAM05491.1 short chain dehydrogenase [Methanosarcina acetivorans C2A]